VVEGDHIEDVHGAEEVEGLETGEDEDAVGGWCVGVWNSGVERVAGGGDEGDGGVERGC
jgi:hypothetical protein